MQNTNSTTSTGLRCPKRWVELLSSSYHLLFMLFCCYPAMMHSGQGPHPPPAEDQSRGEVHGRGGTQPSLGKRKPDFFILSLSLSSGLSIPSMFHHVWPCPKTWCVCLLADAARWGRAGTALSGRQSAAIQEVSCHPQVQGGGEGGKYRNRVVYGWRGKCD